MLRSISSVELKKKSFSLSFETPASALPPPMPAHSANPFSATTPCPFINALLLRCERVGRPLGPRPTVEQLVSAAGEHYRINEKLMRILAKGVAEPDGTVILERLLDTSRFPVHKGALAREDVGLGAISQRKIDELFRFSSPGLMDGAEGRRISLRQLNDFQRWCWSESAHMTPRDRVPAIGEIKLLSGLLAGYADSAGTLPLNLVVTFLGQNILPDDFVPPREPVTNAGILRTLACNAWRILTGR